MKKFSSEYWSIALPDNWEAQHDEDCETLHSPEGPGVLQISALLRDEVVDDAFLRYLAADHLDAGAQTGEVECGDFKGFELSYGAEEEFWREWYLRSGRLTLFVTYHCGLDDEGQEDDVLDSILDRLAAR